MYHNDTKTKTSVVVSYTVKISLLQSKDQDQEALNTCVLCQTQAGKSPPVSRPPLRPTAQRDSEQTQRIIKTPASTTTLVRHRTTSPTDMSANWSSQIGEAKASNWREVGQWRDGTMPARHINANCIKVTSCLAEAIMISPIHPLPNPQKGQIPP